MGRERWGGGNRKGETVKGQMGGGEEGARGEEISQMDMMKCLGGHMECLGGMRLQSFLALFTRATPGTPASSIIYSLVCIFTCSILLLNEVINYTLD